MTASAESLSDGKQHRSEPWREENRSIYEQQGQPCERRAEFSGRKRPGRLIPEGKACFFAYEGKERSNRTYDVLICGSATAETVDPPGY